ncbi:MAG TPA: GIY-YIG nuclease family protein [Ktedonosporobacter sp.]|nr:GIY-YIG nuclease family protein [Ktedonosporobacter sp.]
MEKEHYVYIVRCVDGTLYTGYTTDIERRIAAHNAGKGARYTRAHRPVVLAARWTFATKQEAMRAEYALKGLSRAEKMRLMENLPDQLTMS